MACSSGQTSAGALMLGFASDLFRLTVPAVASGGIMLLVALVFLFRRSSSDPGSPRRPVDDPRLFTQKLEAEILEDTEGGLL